MLIKFNFDSTNYKYHEKDHTQLQKNWNKNLTKISSYHKKIGSKNTKIIWLIV